MATMSADLDSDGSNLAFRTDCSFCIRNNLDGIESCNAWECCIFRNAKIRFPTIVVQASLGRQISSEWYNCLVFQSPSACHRRGTKRVVHNCDVHPSKVDRRKQMIQR